MGLPFIVYRQELDGIACGESQAGSQKGRVQIHAADLEETEKQISDVYPITSETDPVRYLLQLTK